MVMFLMLMEIIFPIQISIILRIRRVLQKKY